MCPGAALQSCRMEPSPYLRWVVTERGIALALPECGGCHVRWIPGPVAGGKPYHGPPSNMPPPNLDFNPFPYGAGIHLPASDSPAMARWRAHSVPWIGSDRNLRIQTMPDEEWDAWGAVCNSPGMQARWDGSIFYPTKIPDLIGIKDRKYFDHTATHRNRGIEDVMRYAAQVMSAESPSFGPYDIVPRGGREVPYRLPDEALYALALYVSSLQPRRIRIRLTRPRRPDQAIFAQNCARCHTPPLYTNNKLTPAKGFQPSGDSRNPDAMALSVGTDPGGALLTRKGTGYYKVPSLKGVWYRGHFLHDGSLASLEEVFDPARLKPDFEPHGWNPPGEKKRRGGWA